MQSKLNEMSHLERLEYHAARIKRDMEAMRLQALQKRKANRRLYCRKYRVTHKEQCQAYARKHHAAHKEQINARRRERRALKKKLTVGENL